MQDGNIITFNSRDVPLKRYDSAVRKHDVMDIIEYNDTQRIRIICIFVTGSEILSLMGVKHGNTAFIIFEFVYRLEIELGKQKRT